MHRLIDTEAFRGYVGIALALFLVACAIVGLSVVLDVIAGAVR